MVEDRETYTMTEAARLLGVCRATIRRYVDRGYLQAERLPSGRRRIKARSLLDLKLQMQQEGKAHDEGTGGGPAE